MILNVATMKFLASAGLRTKTSIPEKQQTATLYGGQKDIATGANVAPASQRPDRMHNSVAMGGFGGQFPHSYRQEDHRSGQEHVWTWHGPLRQLDLADVTTNAAGEFRALHNLSSLGTLEINPTPRLALYFNYGADYASRTDYARPRIDDARRTLRAILPQDRGRLACTANPTAADIAAGGTWGGHWATPALAAVGYGSRLLNNSSCNVASNPGFNGSSTGYYPGGSCGAQTRNVQEFTGGYWYDIYRGEHGRLRQAIQYGYAVRNGWSGAAGIGAKGIDNMFWTSFRYYLP